MDCPSHPMVNAPALSILGPLGSRISLSIISWCTVPFFGILPRFFNFSFLSFPNNLRFQKCFIFAKPGSPTSAVLHLECLFRILVFLFYFFFSPKDYCPHELPLSLYHLHPEDNNSVPLRFGIWDPANERRMIEKERCSGSYCQAVVFLVIKHDSISERPGYWQWGSRYTAHAGRNLPVKEFCYLRTNDTTAAMWSQALLASGCGSLVFNSYFLLKTCISSSLDVLPSNVFPSTSNLYFSLLFILALRGYISLSLKVFSRYLTIHWFSLGIFLSNYYFLLLCILFSLAAILSL